MREAKKRSDGSEVVNVTYPKFKDGEAIVRYVREKQNFGKGVQEIIRHSFLIRVRLIF